MNLVGQHASNVMESETVHLVKELTIYQLEYVNHVIMDVLNALLEANAKLVYLYNMVLKMGNVKVASSLCGNVILV